MELFLPLQGFWSKISFTQCFSFLPRSSKLIFYPGNWIIYPIFRPLIQKNEINIPHTGSQVSSTIKSQLFHFSPKYKMRNVDENNETLSKRSLIDIFKVGTLNLGNFANMLLNDSKLTWPHLLNITHLTNLTELSFSTKHPFQLNLIGLIFLKWWFMTSKCFNPVNLNIYYFSR